jgi:iron complex transport system permease protein
MRVNHAFVSIALLLTAAAVASLCGGVDVRIVELFDDVHSVASQIFWNIRLPRVLLALLVGAALGLSGALTQGLFRNPLADPGLIGITSGAAVAAALTVVVFASAAKSLTTAWQPFVLPVSAFIGALLMCWLLDRAARLLTPGSITGLLLTGLAINAIAAAIIGLCTFLATDEQLRTLSFWTLGSLASAQWKIVLVMLLALTVVTPFALRSAQRLNALALGDAVSAHIGISVERTRNVALIATALLCGISVAWCGMIAFVGLIAPHVVRLAISADHRVVIPYSMVSGALLLLLADTIARTIALPAELPVGILTALIGGPFFLLVLARRNVKLL